MTTVPLPPNSLIGILGGGQLGMMLAQAAHKLGYTTLVWAQSPDECAVKVATHAIIAPFDDSSACTDFVLRIQAASLESENIPPELVAVISRFTRICPSSTILRIASSRIEEKRVLGMLGIPVGPHRVITSIEVLRESDFTEFVFPAILKRATGGYDGRGQCEVKTASDLEATFQSLGTVPCVLETKIDLKCEVSVVVARTGSGETVVYPVIQNWHRDGILVRSQCPGPDVTARIEQDAQAYATRIALELKLVGILVVEMFVMDDDTVLVNELAPRPHNSGHGTIEASVTSQFEQLVRITADLPLGSVELSSGWEMGNFIGLTYEEACVLFPEGAIPIWYGKESRPGRKVGHWTRLLPFS